ncbi:MAG TPA: glycoside hydrolase family 9 protein [Rhizobiaceae bacterium]|nr:glycoside hydrolase family 9 protein [Rhizobiaceae bacterium]
MARPTFPAALIVSFLSIGGASAAELAVNTEFDAGLDPWWATPNLAPTVESGKLCAKIPGGTNVPWDAIIGQNDIKLVQGQSYSLSFTASGEPKGPIRALVQMPRDPYDFYVSLTPAVTPDASEHQVGFTSPVTIDDAQIVLQVGGQAKPWTVCFERVSLQGGADVDAYKPATGPRVRVNQVGYLPDAPRRATLVTESTAPLPWRFLDPAGNEIMSGESQPRGTDTSSGLNVHVIDFSTVDAEGDGFTLEADGDKSYPFAIGPDIYADLARDAMSYFYPVRSGIDIDGVIAGEAYERPAGHISSPKDGETNQGDVDVPCQEPESSQKAYGEPWTCDYTLDVTGGWYDAGDHGKYVVNGGISVAQLMSAYERSLHIAGANKKTFADGALPVPEQGNVVPDVLDEAQWELEFMLKMMVPDGQPLAGLVHHKIHDNEWTGIPLMPHLDDKKRELHRPSTAAALNLAAAAAQGARLFQPHDAEFAAKLLAASEKAYAAAKAHPDIYATAEDGMSGGGPYNDDDVSDEFYWAAAELFVTTGNDNYLADVKASQHATGNIFGPDGFDWAHVAALGRMTLATVPSKLPEVDRAAAAKSIVEAADRYIQMQGTQAFGQIYAPADNMYGWGSNHLIAQNAIVVSRAYDFTGDKKYRDAVLEGIDYLFGRNALNLSYVTGYGERYSKNQHSRWFANQVNPDLPNPPKGSLAGGPNSSIQDPVAQRLLTGCAPQFCYVDEIESWSTNEITINWNAALSQLAAFIVEQK